MAWRKVPRNQAAGRLANARDQLQAARDLSALADDRANGNPIMTAALIAVIAYADALAISFAGIQNRDDHAEAADTLQRAMGKMADNAQISRLGRLISKKNDIQYTHRKTTLTEARAYLEQAERFADWAETTLLTKQIL